MFLNIIFAVSGLALAALISAKMWEEKHRRKPLLLRLVSRGDERVRLYSHELAHKYSAWRDEAHFFIHKQVPLHTKNFVNKAGTVIKERAEKHIGDIRGSKFLKRSDGISEFFKSLEEKESGRIDETLEMEGSQERQEEVK